MKKTASNDLINPKNESLINNHNFNPLTTPKSSRMSKSCKGYCTNNYSEKFSATTKSSNTLNLASTSKESSRDFKESNIISSRKNNVESIRGSFDENNAATSFTSLISIGKPNNLLMVPASDSYNANILDNFDSMNYVITTSDIFTTPNQNQRNSSQRHQSASATLTRYLNSNEEYPSTSFFRASPPNEMFSPIYAASKFSEAPSAKSLPLPPKNWIQDIEERLKCKREIVNSKNEKGIRMNPFVLIAAASFSS